MRVALVRRFGEIEDVEPGELPDPVPAAGQALVRVHGAGAGPWDVGFVGGAASGLALPFVPGFEVAGVVEAVGDGAGARPGERVYASLWPVGGGFAELALASADRLAPMPEGASFAEAAALVIGGGTAYEGLVDRGRLRAGETVLITAAAGGVGTAAVQIAAAVGARPLGVASPANHDYLRSLGAREVFDYHSAGWVEQVRAAVPGGVDLLLDGAGGQTRDQAVGAVRDGGRAIFLVLGGTPAQLERGITGEAFAAHVGWLWYECRTAAARGAVPGVPDPLGPAPGAPRAGQFAPARGGHRGHGRGHRHGGRRLEPVTATHEKLLTVGGWRCRETPGSASCGCFVRPRDADPSATRRSARFGRHAGRVLAAG
jgi:NADPH:quinone reductase